MKTANYAIDKKCKKCDKPLRRDWKFKGFFYCYSCYRTVITNAREKQKI